MVAKSDLQFAGEFLVEECQIVSTTGQVYDINPIVEEINVFENIYTAAISGDIVIKDTTNIVQNFPIIGEEKLILKIQTPQAKPEPETTIDFTLSPLIIYKINTQYGDGENAQIISLQFGSMEGFRNTTSRVSQSYSGVVSTGQFEGTGATFNVTTNGSGNIDQINIATGGDFYEEQELITIGGDLLGGATPANDVTFRVITLSNTKSPFARTDVIQQDFVTRLDSKAFISLDANGSECAWKINRGWNGGTTSYLTVFDSTGDFVELDDCRVEGGQLTSFTANSSITQFDKTSYKGAKTLITIESNDGKVHMLEVTTVCAAAGTTAHATVTNSVTSDNDLVDATIAVAGSNVNISLAKSSAATSSTSFTGRFTTTKVKV